MLSWHPCNLTENFSFLHFFQFYMTFWLMLLDKYANNLLCLYYNISCVLLSLGTIQVFFILTILGLYLSFWKNDARIISRERMIYHYDDVIMTMLASQITSLTVVYSIVYSGVNQRKHQSSASLAFVREIHRGPMNFPHKWPVTRKMFPFDDVIMYDSTTPR